MIRHTIEDMALLASHLEAAWSRHRVADMRRPAFERQRHSTLSKYHCEANEPKWGAYHCEKLNMVQCTNCYAYQVGARQPNYPVPATIGFQQTRYGIYLFDTRDRFDGMPLFHGYTRETWGFRD